MIDRVTNRISTLISNVRFRFQGVKIGRRMWIHGKSPAIYNDGSIIFGERVNFRADTCRSMLTARSGGEIVFGNRVFLNNGVEVHSEKSVRVGDFTRIGPYTSISDTNFHAVDEGRNPKVAEVSIGRNVWIARGVIILPGSRIGDNSVIAAGSVVSGIVPPNQLWRGNPAVCIRDITASQDFIRK